MRILMVNRDMVVSKETFCPGYGEMTRRQWRTMWRFTYRF